MRKRPDYRRRDLPGNLYEKLRQLTEEEYQIISLRYGLHMGYCFSRGATASILSVTQNRVRRVEGRAAVVLAPEDFAVIRDAVEAMDPRPEWKMIQLDCYKKGARNET